MSSVACGLLEDTGFYMATFHDESNPIIEEELFAIFTLTPDDQVILSYLGERFDKGAYTSIDDVDTMKEAEDIIRKWLIHHGNTLAA
jgi:hypothetical protein